MLYEQFNIKIKYPIPVIYDHRGKGRITSSFYPDDRHTVSFCIHCDHQNSFSDGYCDGCGTFYQFIPKKRKEGKGNIKE